MAYQPHFVPPSSPVPPSGSRGFSTPGESPWAPPPDRAGGVGQPTMGQSPMSQPPHGQPPPGYSPVDSAEVYLPAGYPHAGYPPAGQPPAGQRPAGYPGGPGPAAPATYVIQPPLRPQRPAVIGMSASLTATASALWVCALATAWLFAAAGERRLGADQDFDGQVLILLNRFSARLFDGLAVPLFGLPALAFVAAFLILSGRRWAQIAYTLLGAVSVGWLLWWLQYSLGWAVAPVGYIVISVGILWTPAAIRWFGRSPR